MRLVLEVRGERVGIEFGWDIVSKGGAMGCSYSTEDAAVQEAIERDPLFGGRIWCERPPLTPPKEGNEERRTKNRGRGVRIPGGSIDDAGRVVSTPIESIVEARKVLREQYGKSAEETKTKVQVLTLLNELGLDFQF